MKSLLELYAIQEIAMNPLHAFYGEMGLYDLHDTENLPKLTTSEQDHVKSLIKKYGVEDLAQLFMFTWKWKFDPDFSLMRDDRSTYPNVELCREVFKQKTHPVLYRGVKVSKHVPVAKKNVGDTVKMNLAKRSISSWTEKRSVADHFANPSDLDVHDDRTVSMVLQLAGSDAITIAVPANVSSASPWYKKIYYAVTARHGEQGHGDGEGEYILSMANATFKVIDKIDSTDRLPPGHYFMGGKDVSKGKVA